MTNDSWSDAWRSTQVKRAELHALKVIHEPDGKPSFVVPERR